jgi:hypothetical protein
MPQTFPTRRTVRIHGNQIITLHPLTAALSPRTRALLRAIERTAHAERADRIQRPDRPNRIG